MVEEREITSLLKALLRPGCLMEAHVAGWFVSAAVALLCLHQHPSVSRVGIAFMINACWLIYCVCKTS